MFSSRAVLSLDHVGSIGFACETGGWVNVCHFVELFEEVLKLTVPFQCVLPLTFQCVMHVFLRTFAVKL